RSATHGEEKEDQKRIATLRLLVSRAWLGSTGSNEAGGQAAFAFDLLFLLRGWTNTESASGRVGGQCGVSAAWMPR
ncbi:TPA: hypothetical protein ACG4NN_004424, partial [Stenotrophomonas maltophilia]